MTLLIASLRVKNDVSCYHIYLGLFPREVNNFRAGRKWGLVLDLKDKVNMEKMQTYILKPLNNSRISVSLAY
jgi:hypothetical protein